MAKSCNNLAMAKRTLGKATALSRLCRIIRHLRSGIVVADAHRDDGKRLVVHADEKLTAFLELERVTRHDRN